MLLTSTRGPGKEGTLTGLLEQPRESQVVSSLSLPVGTCGARVWAVGRDSAAVAHSKNNNHLLLLIII